MKDKMIRLKDKLNTEKTKKAVKTTVGLGVPVVLLTGLAYYALENAYKIDYGEYVEAGD